MPKHGPPGPPAAALGSDGLDAPGGHTPSPASSEAEARASTDQGGRGDYGACHAPDPSLTRRNQLQISLFFSWGKNRFGQLRPTEGRSSYLSASHPRRGGLSHGWEGSRRHHLGDLGEKLQVLDFSRVTGD